MKSGEEISPHPGPGAGRHSATEAAGQPSGARSAALVTAGILLSRLAGLLRQRVTAHYFGTSAYADILAAAFRVGNITQNLLGEGTLSASFIPVYAKLRARGRIGEAVRFALASLGALLAAVVVLSALGVLLAPWLTWLIAAGFDPDKLARTARVVRVLFPMTGLLVLSAWGLGVLNAHRRFFLPYAAPVVWSGAQIVVLIAAGSYFGLRDEPLSMALAWGAFAGAALQLALLLPVAKALLGSLRPRWDLKNPDVREAGRRLPAALLGRGVIQLSGLVDTLLVSLVQETGANAVFAYAQTVYLLPMSILGTGEAAVALPAMAGDSAEADQDRRNRALRARLGASLARLTAVTVPVTLAFVFLGGEIIGLLLQTGSFDASSTSRVKPLLAAYGFALLGNASGRVLTTAAYALGDTKTPAHYAVYRVIASTAIALVLMRPLGVLGVVLGAVIAAWVETVALGMRLWRQIGGLGLEAVRAGRIILLGVVSTAMGLGVRIVLPAGFGATTAGSAVVLAGFAVGFAVAAPALGLFDLRSFIQRK